MDSFKVPDRPIERGGLYMRVSDMGDRDPESETFRSVIDQRAEAIAHLHGNASLIVDEYIDLDVSGKRARRPELDRLFADLESGRIDFVLVAYLSRLGRSGVQIQTNVERIKSLGGVFLEARNGIDTRKDQSAKLLLAVLGVVAELEWDRLVASLWGANDAAIDRGVSIVVPYGYQRSNGHGSVLEPDRDETFGVSPAAVVELIYRLRLDGMGSSAIARHLTELSIPTPAVLRRLRDGELGVDPVPWRHNSIRGIISTPTYMGVIPREIDGELELVRAPDGDYAHAPLISERSWHRAQFSDTRPASYGRNGDALLAGIIRCESCSATMSPGSGGTSKMPIYKCANPGCRARASIGRDIVERYVVEQVLEGRAPGMQRDVQDSGERQAREERLARAQVRVQRLLELDAADLAAGELRQMWSAAKRERNDAQRELAEYRQREPLDEPFEELPPEAQQRALARLVVVVVAPAGGRGKRIPVDERVSLVNVALVPDDLPRSGRRGGYRPFPYPSIDAD